MVTRPEPGLARGVWEAPRWAFFAALAVIVVFAVIYALVRSGLLGSKRVRVGSASTAGGAGARSDSGARRDGAARSANEKETR
jgi:hypothetical protein